jgi:hypothetical protein
LTVTYPGHRTRQISVRRERVAEVRKWLANYRELKESSGHSGGPAIRRSVRERPLQMAALSVESH